MMLNAASASPAEAASLFSQRAPGHRQITTTEIYARASDEMLRQAVAAA